MASRPTGLLLASELTGLLPACLLPASPLTDAPQRVDTTRKRNFKTREETANTKSVTGTVVVALLVIAVVVPMLQVRGKGEGAWGTQRKRLQGKGRAGQGPLNLILTSRPSSAILTNRPYLMSLPGTPELMSLPGTPL